MYHILPRCYCDNCIARYKIEGIDINDDAAVEKSMALASKEHMKQLRQLIAKYHPNATVFFNATPHVNNYEVFKEKLYTMNTQQELEDLPTTWGGYDKLPNGKSLVPSLNGKVVKREPIFFEHEANRAVIDENWKLVSKGTRKPPYEGEWELYDLLKDPAEAKNLMASYPKIDSRLSVLWVKWANENHIFPLDNRGWFEKIKADKGSPLNMK